MFVFTLVSLNHLVFVIFISFFINKILIFSFIFVTLDHKTSYKGQFFEIEIYTSSESFPLMYGLLGSDNIWPRYNYLKIWNLRVQTNLNIEKITFKFVQIKFLAMHITNQKLRFDIFTVGNLQNIFMEHDLYLMS